MSSPLTQEVHPLADPANMLSGPTYRITVLDAGLVRLEHSNTGEFEDRASQAVVDRAFPATEFTVTETDDRLEIDTARLHLSFDRKPFSTEGLSVRAKGGFRSERSIWRYGVPLTTLGGTARTLDEVDGALPLEDGVVSANGISMFDDSTTVLLTDDGWIAPRRKDNLDLYVFAYGRDYKEALKALYRLTGSQPLLPRFALGNWWSRYHPYSAEEYLALMQRFRAEHIPFSVAVLDMDWHWVDIDPRFGSGWTGYSWNTDLFPDPKAFLGALHDLGLATTLNVHPADGVHAHEARYPAIARRMGIDPAAEVPVAFDPTDRELLTAYFEELHHPLEDDGVDFWWLDWQQGGVTSVPGLDPLWLLNHFHYLDSGRDGRRPLTFSRYAGVGSHRYPVGFSGDTVITWASLDFQPYFTSTASNVGYGWWSHDIGGHFFGAKDDELVARWVQFGVFSPIMRLHSTLSPFNTKEPWRFGEQTERVMSDFLRLRHRLLPYLHTMNRRAHAEGEPLVQPMYYDHPERDEAYDVPNQYMFGSELLVAPVTTPADRSTGLGEVRAWLPPGDWVDVFTGLAYRGDRRLHLHRDHTSIPVLAKAGAIVPVVPELGVGFGVEVPEVLEVRVYAGADGSFVLAEDRDDERWAETPLRYDAATGVVSIGPVSGDLDSVPASRDYEVLLCGFTSLDGATAMVGDGESSPELVPGSVPGSVHVSLVGVPAAAGATVRLSGDLSLTHNADMHDRMFRLVDRAQIPFALKEAIWTAVHGHDDPVSAVLALDLERPLLLALVEVLRARP